MRRFQDRMRAALGGRGGGGGGGGEGGRGPLRAGSGLFVLGALLAAGWVASGVYMVDENERAVVTRFGAFDRTTGPGLHMHLPPPIESARTVEVTTQRREDIGFGDNANDLAESLMLTGDENIVDIDFTVLYRLDPAEGEGGGPYNFLFNIRDPQEIVRGVAESAMREVVGRSNLEQIITTARGQIEQDVEALMQNVLNNYQSGVLVLEVQLAKAAAPAEVVDAFDDVVRAGQDAETAINEAQRFRNEVIPGARAEANVELQTAQAYQERVVREASGEAERFRLILDQYRAAPRVTRDRMYYETLERVLRDADVMIIDGGAGVTPYLPLNELRRRENRAATPQAPARAQPVQPGAQGG